MSFEDFSKYYDCVSDGICAITDAEGVIYANESLLVTLGISSRFIRNKNLDNSLLMVPIELKDMITTALATTSSMETRELDLTLKSGRILRAQIRIEKLSGFNGLVVFLKDVDVEYKVHTKYRVQLARNQELIDGLRRNLSEAEFLGKIVGNFSISEEVETLLGAICDGLEKDLGYQRTAFLKIRNGNLDSSTKNVRVHGSIRYLTSQIITSLEELKSLPSGSTKVLQTPGTDVNWLLVNVKPRLDECQVLVVMLESEYEVESKVFLSNLGVNVSALLDTRALYTAASSDPLTKVFNRRYFDTRLALEVNRVKSEFSILTLVFIDVDHFKKINDDFGHHGGDLVLKAVAERLKYRLRDDDVVARIGGEEFALLLPGTRAEEALIVAERLRQHLSERPIRITDNDGKSLVVNITASFGISEISPQKGTNEERLFKEADSALYYSKQNGRNRVTIFTNQILNAA